MNQRVNAHNWAIFPSVLQVLHAFFHHEMKFSHLRFWRQRILGDPGAVSFQVKARLTWKLYASPDSRLVSTNCPWVTVMTTTRTLWLSMKTIRAKQAKGHFPHFVQRDQQNRKTLSLAQNTLSWLQPLQLPNTWRTTCEGTILKQIQSSEYKLFLRLFRSTQVALTTSTENVTEQYSW